MTVPEQVQPRPPAAAPGGGDETIMLISSNGTGMGHLTRLLAYARRLPQTRVQFVSLSLAAPVVERFGYPVEYIPSRDATGLATSAWHPFFAARLRDVVYRHQPSVVVFDGTYPYPGFEQVMGDFPQVRWVWSRRGMWREGLNTSQIAKAQWFDAVIEPGDLSAPYDRGATVAPRLAGSVSALRPVTLLDPSDLSTRAQSREALGLPAEGPLALVALGSGAVWDAHTAIGAMTQVLRDQGVGVCVTQNALAERTVATEGIHVVRDFPLSRRLAAFDLGVAAAGYNSFHENLRLGLPSIFVPNLDAKLDDQVARARYAHDQGWAILCQPDELAESGPAVQRLLAEGPAMAQAARSHDPGNGAHDAATRLLELIS